MALFLVTPKGKKKTLGVYYIQPYDRLGGTSARFLLWDTYWKWVEADDYEPLELDNIFAEDSNADGLSNT